MRSAASSPSTSSRTSARMPSDVLDAVDRGDVRMIQRREQARLALEAREPLGIGGERRRQDLDRDVAAEPGVARAVDLAHAARAERCHHLVDAEPRTGGERQGTCLTSPRPASPRRRASSGHCRRAAHSIRVATYGSTRFSATTRPFAVTVIGCEKSNASGEKSSVSSLTPRVTSCTALPRRVASTRPDGRVCAKRSFRG